MPRTVHPRTPSHPGFRFRIVNGSRRQGGPETPIAPVRTRSDAALVSDRRLGCIRVRIVRGGYEMDDDKFRLIVDGKELASIVPSLEEHDVPVGGSVRCRDTSGAVGVTMQASGAQFGGSSLTVRDGGIFVSSAEGKSRVAIHSGERLENEDSGVVKLTAGDGWKIVLNASKHSVEISAADETKIITLDAVSPD